MPRREVATYAVALQDVPRHTIPTVKGGNLTGLVDCWTMSMM
jgi:hypothetical protein